MSEQWGAWDCPYDGCDEHDIQDPDSIYVTCCGNGHSVILGRPENGRRWSEKYVPTDTDVMIAVANSRIWSKQIR